MKKIHRISTKSKRLTKLMGQGLIKQKVRRFFLKNVQTDFLAEELWKTFEYFSV